MTEADRLMLEEMMANTEAMQLDKHAKLVRDFYTAYKKAGFTPSQSLELVKQLIDTTHRTSMLIEYSTRMKQPPV